MGTPRATLQNGPTYLMMLYSGIVAFQSHPRNVRMLSPNECMKMALDYYYAYELVVEELWPGLVPRSEQVRR